jgi:hypothetical protein
MEKPWKVIAAFVGVFIAGSIFGGLLALRLSRHDLAVRRDDAPRATLQTAVVPSAPTAAGQVQNPASTPRPAAPVPQLQLPPSMAAQAPQLMRRYVDRLGLTPEQKERINPLIQRASTDLKWQQQTNLRQTGIVIQRLQEEIGKELTPVQRGKMQEMEAKQLQLIEAREKQQQEQAKQQQEKMRAQAQKSPSKDGGKTKAAAGKTPEDGN